jgi:hypothetical protein
VDIMKESHLRQTKEAKDRMGRQVYGSMLVGIDRENDRPISVMGRNLSVEDALELRRVIASAVSLVENERVTDENLEKAEEAYEWEQASAHDDTHGIIEHYLEGFFLTELVQIWQENEEDATDEDARQ